MHRRGCIAYSRCVRCLPRLSHRGRQVRRVATFRYESGARWCITPPARVSGSAWLWRLVYRHIDSQHCAPETALSIAYTRTPTTPGAMPADVDLPVPVLDYSPGNGVTACASPCGSKGTARNITPPGARWPAHTHCPVFVMSTCLGARVIELRYTSYAHVHWEEEHVRFQVHVLFSFRVM